MNFERNIDQLTKLSQNIKTQQPPAVTIHQKQAAITMADIEKCIHELIMEKMSPQIMCYSLFYFWLILEAPLRDVTEDEIDQWSMSLDEAVARIIHVIKSKVDSLPDHEPTPEMEKLGEGVNTLKSYLSDEAFVQMLSPDEHVKQSTNINTRIHTITSELLKKSFHPEIVSNVLFNYWLRLSTLHVSIPEEFHQKLEFYFKEIISAARKQVPILFKQ